MRDLAFILLTLSVIPYALSRPYVAIPLWAWTSLIAPNDFLFGLGTLIPFVKLAAGITVISLLFNKEKKSLYADRVTVMVLLFLLIAISSQLISFVESGWVILDKLWKIVLMHVLVVSFMRSRARIHGLLLAICLGVGFFAVSNALKFLVSGGKHIIGGVGNWGDNNHVALIVLMILPILGYIRGTSEVKVVRVGALVGLVLSTICVIATSSRGGFIGLVVIAVFAVSATRHKVRYITALLIAAAILSQTVPAKWSDRMSTIETVDQDNSFMGRVIAWKMSVLIALNNPFFGGGLHAVQSRPVWNQYKPEFGRLSFVPTNDPDVSPHAAHSIYFEVLGDTGFSGLSTFLLILAWSFRNAARIRDLAADKPELRWAKDLARALRISLIAYAITGAGVSAAYHDLPFLIFAILSAVHGMVATRERSVERRPKLRPQEALAAASLRSPGESVAR